MLPFLSFQALQGWSQKGNIWLLSVIPVSISILLLVRLKSNTTSLNKYRQLKCSIRNVISIGALDVKEVMNVVISLKTPLEVLRK